MLEPSNSFHNTSTRKILWVIFLTVFIDMLGIGILIPVFPLLVLPSSSFNVLPSGWSEHQAYIMAGWLMAMFPLMQFIFTPLMGQYADRFGRKKVLLISICGTLLSYLVFAYAVFSRNLILMFISRAFDGITGANIAVAQTVIADISEPKYRARNFGLTGMALGSGFILGPFLGGVLSNPQFVAWFNAATPFLFTALLGVVNLLMVIFLLPETITRHSYKVINLTKPFSNIIRVFSIKQVSPLILTLFLFNGGFAFFTTFWGISLATRFGFNQSQIGNFFAYFGIMVVLAQGMVVRRLSGKVIDYIVLRYSLFGSGISILAYYFISTNQAALVYCIPPLLAVFIALSKAFSNALLTRITPEHSRGEIMGINSSCNALANAIPALLAGYLAGAYHVILPALVGGITIIAGGILFVFAFKDVNVKDHVILERAPKA